METKDNLILTALFVGVLVFFFVVVFGNRGLVVMWRMSKEKARIEAVNADMQRHNARFVRTIERLKNDPAFVESFARDEMGLVGEGEIVIRFKDAPPPLAARPESSKISPDAPQSP
ncbi:MAG: septum formation initiator family protein [Desulfatibacillaceae bacterium]|nr:septum formation initiator family protein [Desulfatibacillaceae bacterium]